VHENRFTTFGGMCSFHLHDNAVVWVDVDVLRGMKLVASYVANRNHGHAACNTSPYPNDPLASPKHFSVFLGTVTPEIAR
jgi:hypothetical protein